MQLYLIRHAESANNAKPTFLRVEDPPITAVGRLQTEHLAKWLSTLRADLMITSPFLRTLQTSLPAIKSTTYSVNIWHDVYERGGCYRGHTPENISGGMGLGRSDIIRLLGEHSHRCRLDDSINDDGWWGGRAPETDEQAATRALQVCNRLQKTFTDGEVVVLLIHADLKRLMLESMLEGQVNVSRLGPMRNTGITKINWTDAQWQLDYFNSVSHLPARLITGNEH